MSCDLSAYNVRSTLCVSIGNPTKIGLFINHRSKSRESPQDLSSEDE